MAVFACAVPCENSRPAIETPITVSDFKGIPIVRSGEKYQTPAGFSAIKNGVNRNRGWAETPWSANPPGCVRSCPTGPGFDTVRRNVRENKLSTVCEESMCPNIGECWNAGTATIMLMGSVCTRACRFCAVDTGNPSGWLDAGEPEQAAQSVALMNLRYVVLTSVDRDDLRDGGAGHYAACIRAIQGAQSADGGRGIDAGFPGQP